MMICRHCGDEIVRNPGWDGISPNGLPDGRPPLVEAWWGGIDDYVACRNPVSDKWMWHEPLDLADILDTLHFIEADLR